jgi:hypothetical protein
MPDWIGAVLHIHIQLLKGALDAFRHQRQRADGALTTERHLPIIFLHMVS